MLSFRVKCAIQVLAELERAGTEGGLPTITEIKQRCGSGPSGFASHGLSRALFALRCKHWVESVNRKHYIAADLSKATLYDLVIAMDEGLYMGPNIAIECWPYKNMDKYGHVMELDDCLKNEMEQKLKGIPLAELLACQQSTGHKLPVKVRRRAAGAKIVDGTVVFENRY